MRGWVVLVSDGILRYVLGPPPNSPVPFLRNRPVGAMQSVGVIQSYLTLHQLESYPIRDIGWVTGLYTFLGTFLGLFVGNLADTYGPMKLAPFAFFLVVPTYVLLAQCTQYWHFMLCLGVLGGAGASWASLVAIAVVGKLPLRRRGLAMGASLTGASSGGIVYPLMLRYLFPAVGWAWSMRIVALLKAVLIIGGLLCYLPLFRGRIQLQGKKEAATPTIPSRKGLAKFVDLTAFLSPAFATLAVGFFFLEYALFAVSGILPTFAAFAGFSPESGYTLIAIMNTCQVPGRVLPGLLADRVGHFDVFLLSIIVTMIPIGALFVPFGAKSIGALYAFAALWGFTSSAWLALVPGELSHDLGCGSPADQLVPQYASGKRASHQNSVNTLVS